MRPPVLIGDIGGTNARFALAEEGAAAPRRAARLACADHPGLAEAAAAYLARVAPEPPPRSALFAVAAPVDGDRVEMTNHPWTFSIAAIRARLALETLRVVNDFTALAAALPELGPADWRPIGGGEARPGTPIALLGPGTGLGVSGLVPAGSGWVPLATEGGHATLAPVGAREAAVTAMLARRFGHVSVERAVSGPGLVNLTRAVAALDGRPPPPGDPAAIGAAAGGGDPVAGEALDMFAAMLGTAAADLALGLGARGGVYIGGGVVPGLGSRFPETVFRDRFEDKGRYRAWLAAVPTRVITRPHPTLPGLTALARKSA